MIVRAALRANKLTYNNSYAVDDGVVLVAQRSHGKFNVFLNKSVYVHPYIFHIFLLVKILRHEYMRSSEYLCGRNILAGEKNCLFSLGSLVVGCI